MGVMSLKQRDTVADRALNEHEITLNENVGVDFIYY